MATVPQRYRRTDGQTYNSDVAKPVRAFCYMWPVLCSARTLGGGSLTDVIDDVLRARARVIGT